MSNARILHVHSTFDHGGKEARTVKLMDNLSDLAKHAVLVGDPNTLGACGAINSDVAIMFSDVDSPAISGKPSLIRYWQLARYMRQFDLILTYSWGAMDVVMAHRLFSNLLNLPKLIHHEDGFNQDESAKLNWKRNWFRRFALKRARAVVVPSQTLEDIAISHWGVGNEILHHIRNGIDIETFLSAEDDNHHPAFVKKPDEIIVGTLAGLRPVKNLPRLVRAVAMAGDNIRLVIVGEGPARAEIELEAKRLKITDRLIMAGFVEDPSYHLRLFDIFALSSDSEQFPISLAEAMASGCAVVATNVGDIRNMVAQANQPYVVPRDDELALGRAIKKLAENKEIRRILGSDNGQRAANEYKDSIMFARYRKLYSDALDCSR